MENTKTQIELQIEELIIDHKLGKIEVEERNKAIFKLCKPRPKLTLKQRNYFRAMIFAGYLTCLIHWYELSMFGFTPTALMEASLCSFITVLALHYIHWVTWLKRAKIKPNVITGVPIQEQPKSEGQCKPTPENDLSDESLIAEAKRRYPEGTVFLSAHLGNNSIYNRKHTITCSEFKKVGSYIEALNIDFDWEKQGVPNVYHNGKWAEIVSQPFNDRRTEIK